MNNNIHNPEVVKYSVSSAEQFLILICSGRERINIKKIFVNKNTQAVEEQNVTGGFGGRTCLKKHVYLKNLIQVALLANTSSYEMS